MAQTIDLNGLVRKLHDGGKTRRLVGLAGPPGSGKSTIAQDLEQRLNAQASGFAAILPMDGFHYDDMLLNHLGRKARKGAPDTFDVDGFRHILQRLRSNEEATVAVPVFDRDIEISRGGARLIQQDISIIIVEGNYLFLRQQPWALLGPMFDVTVMINTPDAILHDRLTKRWQAYDLPQHEIQRRVNENDMPNGRFVVSESAGTDFVLNN